MAAFPEPFEREARVEKDARHCWQGQGSAPTSSRTPLPLNDALVQWLSR